MAWQKIFKKYLKKYNIKIKELNEIHVYEENEKGMVFKALNLSLSEINGSMTCNYYTKGFEIYGNYKGYQLNLYDKYDEKEGFYYPISVFNQKIEELDNKTVKKIILPEKKNITWVKNSEMGLNNIKKIIEPIKYQNEEWHLIYGQVRLNGKSNNKYGNDWIDTYIVNWSINEKYNLCKYSEADRNYTIETKKYKGNIADYKLKKYTMTTSLHSSSDFKDVYATTDFDLPPTYIIKEFDLYYNKSTSSWNNKNGEIVILVNNNEGICYHAGCSGTLYLKKEYYDRIMKKHICKYFCFTEKFHPSTGYCDDSELQIQIDKDNTITKYKHYKMHKRNTNENICCKNRIVCKKEKADRKKYKSKFYEFLLDDVLD